MIGTILKLLLLLFLIKMVIAIGFAPHRLATDMSNPFNFILFQEPVRKYERELVTDRIQKPYLSGNSYIPARLIRGKQDDQLLIYSHGNSEDMSTCLFFAQQLSQITGKSVVVYDPPGYGLNEAESSDERTAKAFNQTLTAVIDHYASQQGIAKENIVLVGRSLGCGSTLANADKAGLCVLVSPFLSVKQMVADYLGDWASVQVEERWDNMAMLRRTKTPVLIVHGEEDSLTNVEHAIQLGQEAAGLYVLPGKDHNDIGARDVMSALESKPSKNYRPSSTSTRIPGILAGPFGNMLSAVWGS
jgi:alpha-beta hydrolase superfamily lysophospholipase